MKKELIAICDLTHTATNTYATNLMPYPIASIKSNLLRFSKHKESFEVEIFKHPQKFITTFLSNPQRTILATRKSYLKKNSLKIYVAPNLMSGFR